METKKIAGSEKGSVGAESKSEPETAIDTKKNRQKKQIREMHSFL